MPLSANEAWRVAGGLREVHEFTRLIERTATIIAVTGFATGSIDGEGVTDPRDDIGDGGPAASASFHSPGGVAFDRAGNLFVADELNYPVRRIERRTVGQTQLIPAFV